MKDRFNLEEEISQLHNFADQLGTLSEGILEHNLSQDEVSNGLEGLKVLLTIHAKIINIPHYLGDYGYTSLNGVNFFFYRGAYSIDRQYRTIGIDWWEQEQVKIEQFMKARELYRQIKPDIVLTHDCPESIAPYLLPPGCNVYQNMTSWALQELFNIHQPSLWRFGHYHNSWSMKINGTDFRCLNELEIEKI